MVARVELIPMKATLVLGLLEDGEFLDFTEGVVVNTSWPYCPVTCTGNTVFHDFVLAFQKMLLEFACRLAGEYLIQSDTDAVNLLSPDGVALADTDGIVSSSLEIDIDLIFRNTAGHQLSITAQDVAATRFYADAVTFQTICHLRPIGLFGSHDIHGLANYGKTNQCHDYCDGEVAGHYLIAFKLTHSVSLFWYINNIRWLVSNVEQTVFVLL